MKLIYDIPASFWGLFRSVNRDIYIEALLTINDEYQYNNYFLSREACVQILSDMCSSRRYAFMREDNETEEDVGDCIAGSYLKLAGAHKMAQKNRRLRGDDHQYRHTGLCGSDDRGI